MRKLMFIISRLILICIAYSLLVACSTTPVIDDSKIIDSTDPFEDANRSMYSFNDSLDIHIMKPIASTYVDITPAAFRGRVTNFFDNVGYINVFLNSSLQGKLDQSLSDLFRFIFNSTLGIAGLFDVATYMGLDEHEEDLGQTFAVWGSSQGPYLYLPALGPNSVRDAPDLVSSYLLDPLSYVTLTISLPVAFLDFVNTRANFLSASDFRDSAAIDPYSFTREAYLQSRRNLIYDGNPPAESFDDFFDFEDDDTTL